MRFRACPGPASLGRWAISKPANTKARLLHEFAGCATGPAAIASQKQWSGRQVAGGQASQPNDVISQLSANPSIRDCTWHADSQASYSTLTPARHPWIKVIFPTADQPDLFVGLNLHRTFEDLHVCKRNHFTLTLSRDSRKILPVSG